MLNRPIPLFSLIVLLSPGACVSETGIETRKQSAAARAGQESLYSAADGSGDAGDAPDAARLNLRSVSVSGSGCPEEDSVTSSLSEDAQAFTLIFSDYVLEIFGEEDNPIAEQKECRINFELEAPSGWSWALLSTQLRGYAFLEEGSGAAATTSFHMNGRSSPDGSLKLAGEFDDLFQLDQEFPLKSLIWSTCDTGPAEFEIHTRLKAWSDGIASPYVSIDTLDGELAQTHRIVWRRCKVPAKGGDYHEDEDKGEEEESGEESAGQNEADNPYQSVD